MSVRKHALPLFYEVSRTETSNEVFNLQKCIAKAEMPALKKGLSGLERYEVKVSRTVLRGLRHEVAYVFVVLEYS
jgi:hypothetical protein